MFEEEERIGWIKRYAPSAIEGAECRQPYHLRTVPLSQITPDDFIHSHFMQHRPVLVRSSFGCTSVGTSSPIAVLGGLDDTALFLHPDISNDEAEVTITQSPGDVTSAVEYPGTLTCTSVCHLLQERRCTTTDGGSNSSIYAKISTTHSSDLSACVAEFLNNSEPLEPVVHPMLLRSGAYFSWAFIGEALSGSKTHVDVMGSDAWLVVLQGRKLWAMCHPEDKHLVMDEATGTFANLLAIDASAFPRAHLARISYFIQERGDAIFVPGDAPHAVLNLEFSTSITFNFMFRKTSFTWRRMMQRVVNEDTADGILDVVLVSSAATDASTSDCQRTTLTIRLQLSARCFATGMLATEFGVRVMLGEIYSALAEQHGAMFRADGIKSVGWPRGWDAEGGGGHTRRLIWYYDVDGSSMEELLERCCVKTRVEGSSSSTRDGETVHDGGWLSTNYNVLVGTRSGRAIQPLHLCTTYAAHIGQIPSLPPLCVILQQMWAFDTSWAYKSLVSILQERRRRAAAASSSGDAVNDGLGAAHSTAPMSMWHYSRFPFRHSCAGEGVATSSSSGRQWSCMTYLFYASPYLVGPINLYPMVDDRTLQSSTALLISPPSSASSVAYDPHIEEFHWNVGNVINPAGGSEQAADDVPMLCVLDLGDDLVSELCKKLLLTDSGPSFIQFCSRHKAFAGINNVDWSTIGIEKLAILALHFSCRPGVVGFTYNYTFRNVTEPSTVCLTGSAGEHLLIRVPGSKLAAAATALCALIENGGGAHESPCSELVLDDGALAPVLAVVNGPAEDGEVDSCSTAASLDWVRHVISIKQQDISSLVASDALDSDQELRRCSEKLQRAQLLLEHFNRRAN